MPVILTLPPPKSPVWYLAYGSNLSSRKFIHDRGITPLGIAVVAVPGFTLTLDSAGVPYSEPAYASISPGECVHAEKPMPLIGTAYLVTDEMYKKVIKSEGGGIAYREVEVQALVEASTDRRVITARTLVTVLPRRALPSLRYMNLLQTGAREVHIPKYYQEYLANLPTYHPPKCGYRKTGATLFLAFWVPVMAIMEKITKSSLKKSDRGNAPLWVIALVRLVVITMWWWHDHVHAPIWGRGDGLEDDALIRKSETA